MKNVVLFTSMLILLEITNAEANNSAPEDSIVYLINDYQYDKALILVDRLMNGGEQSKNLFYLRGAALKGIFNYNKAIDSYLKALTFDSLDNQILIELAYTYRLLLDYTNSLKYFTLSLKNDTSNKMLQIECANCKYYLDLYRPAINDFYNIYQEDTSNYFVIRRLAFCYNKLEQNDSSSYFYKKAIRMNPRDPNNILSICNILILQKDYEQGIQISEEFISVDSTNRMINSQNAYLYLLKKNYHLSISKFKNCLHFNDTSKFVLKNMGIAYFKLGGIDNCDTAKYYLERAFLIDTTDTNALHYLGLACSQSYYKNLGIYYLEKAVQQYSTFISEYSVIYRNLFEACRSWDKCPCEKTLSLGIRSYELNPEDTLLTFYIGYSYDNCRKNKENAIKYYTIFMETRPPVDDKDDPRTSNYLYVEDRLKVLRNK